MCLHLDLTISTIATIMSAQRPSHIDIPPTGMNGTTVSTDHQEAPEIEMQDVQARDGMDEHESNRRGAPNGPFTPLADPSFKRKAAGLDRGDMTE